MGAVTAYPIIDELDFKASDIAVEIGSERGGGSTAYLRNWCAEHQVPFMSVDIDPYNPHADVHMDGAAFLASRTGGIRFAYLDAFDWTWEGSEQADFIVAQRARYAQLGMTMTNEQSQRAHLAMAAIIDALAGSPTCTILFDDTWREDDHWDGKGGTAVRYLEERGWRAVQIGPRHGAVRCDR